MIFQEKTGITPSYRVQALADTPVVQSMNGVKALVVGYPHRPQEGQVMGEPVHTPLRIRAELMEMVKSPAYSEAVVEVVLLSIRLVVVVVVPWQWMQMDLLLLILPYWPWEVTVWTEAPEVQADQSAYRPIIFP